ncbi:MAG: UvrD-helicase domain-containing protein [Verrucomicrobiota bacterium]
MQQFLRCGGAHSQAAKKACEIENKLRLGIDVRSQTTDHGESRIKNCIKYDLGNGYRLVTVQQAEVVVLVYIGDHDSTQKWLARHEGLVAVVDQKSWKVEFTTPNAPQPWQVAPPTSVSLNKAPYLSQVEGIDWKATIKSAAIRSFLVRFDQDVDNQELLDILEELKKEQAEVAELCLVVINQIMAGQIEAAQAAIDLYLGRSVATSEATPLTGEILRAEANQGRFVVINDLSEAEVARLYDPLRFREWMIFLHPGQRRVVDEEFDGPALLTGVSGSGKTCVLIHRARRLARFFSSDRILILTLNRSLARLIENMVSELCMEGEMSRIDVKSFHDYLCEVLSSLDCGAFLRQLADFTAMVAEVDAFLSSTPNAERTKMFKPLTEPQQMNAFDEFLAEPGNPAKVEFDRLEVFVFSQDQTIDLRRYLFEELELVRSAFTCYDGYRGYYECVAADSLEFKYQRSGRSIVFAEKRRNAIVAILREWEKFQIRRGFLDLMGLTQAALFATEEQGAIPDKFRYRAVLVDEFQDFSTLELLLLTRIPKFAENGLFLTGDFAQKIYAKDLNLPAIKLGRNERTDRIIRRNFRNTRQILLAAHALITAYPPQLAGGEEGGTIIEPEYASQPGATPIATKATEPIRAAWQYADEWLRGGHVPFTVCIATANPHSISVEAIMQQMPTGVKADILTGDYLLREKWDRIVVADIATVKGFEFSLIIICGVEEGVFPPKGVPAAEHWREALRFYVAITRGRDEVRFIYQNAPSVFLRAMADRIQFQIWETPPEAEPFVEPKIKPEVDSRAPVVERVGEPTVEALVQPIVEAVSEVPSDEAAVVSKPDPIIQPTTKGGPSGGFYDRHNPEVINGILLVPIQYGASQWELAVALGCSQTAVSIACQRLGWFTAPNTALPAHIIEGVCDDFRCVPNLLNRY